MHICRYYGLLVIEGLGCAVKTTLNMLEERVNRDLKITLNMLVHRLESLGNNLGIRCY